VSVVQSTIHFKQLPIGEFRQNRACAQIVPNSGAPWRIPGTKPSRKDRGGHTPELLERFFSGDVDWAVTLLLTGRLDQARRRLDIALDRNAKASGGGDWGTAGIRGLRAAVLALQGERPVALREFATASRTLLGRSSDLDDEVTPSVVRDQRLKLVLARYVQLLVEVRGHGTRASGTGRWNG